MHPFYEKADGLGSKRIGAAIKVHRNKGKRRQDSLALNARSSKLTEEEDNEGITNRPAIFVFFAVFRNTVLENGWLQQLERGHPLSLLSVARRKAGQLSATYHAVVPGTPKLSAGGSAKAQFRREAAYSFSTSICLSSTRPGNRSIAG